MKALLFHKTVDADLKEGMKVLYKDLLGSHTLIGTIEKIHIINDGSSIYIVEGAAYTADELKLIEEPAPVDTWDELKSAVLDHNNFVQVTEKLFYDALEVLPPKYLGNGCFQVSECYTADLYYTFGEKNGKYYGCLCNKNFALHNF